ncbi:unnamed protein product [marine sediment metagenome]|uniref:Uncharacterized protein n=1 Tax=marine sediment metagenome TaxID=412755 RepID=X1HYV9_9ZZZZ
MTIFLLKEEIKITLNNDFDEDYEIEVINPCLSLLQKYTNLHSELNYEKIKEILLIILKEMNEREIQKSENIIILTAAVIWHNTFNRSGDKDYLLQENIEK